MAKHLTFSNVVASLALFCALTGTAIAAKTLITKPSQLRNGVVTNNKVKKGTLRVNRLHKSARRALKGNRGPQGEPGAPGLPGADGATAWDRPLPSGETIRGLWELSETGVPSGGVSLLSVVSFPVEVPQSLLPPADGVSGISINGNNGQPNAAIAEAINDEFELPACTGSVVNTTAPPGHLCVYVRSTDFLNVQAESLEISGGIGLGGAGGDSLRLGFLVDARTKEAGTLRARGTWAYVAP